MTDTAREAAIERVRACVEAMGHCGDSVPVRAVNGRSITLGDLRLLLTDPRQPSEGPYRDDTALKFPAGEGEPQGDIRQALSAYNQRTET